MVTTKLSNKFQQTSKPVKDKNENPLATTDEQLKRWLEHFEELLNRTAPEKPLDIQPADTDLPINCDIPTKTEIRRAINMLKNGKAVGIDEIPAEAIKADTETSVSIPFNLLKKICEEESIPEEWKEGMLIKLPQKGATREYSNYRGVMILSVPGKVLNRIE